MAHTILPHAPPTSKESEAERDAGAIANCRSRGGTWDPDRRTCILPKPKQEEKKEEEVKAPGALETFTDPDTGRASGITLPDGRTFLGLSPEEIQKIATGEQERVARPEGTAPVGTAREQARILAEGQRLAGQVGEFGELPISPTGLDIGEAAISGAISGVPRALALAGTAAAAGAVIGLATGPAAPVVSPTLAAIGGALTFIGSISSSMISNFKSQRTDTTTSQQRVLDEGKQSLQDWATQAAADPSNSGFYLGKYNSQLALIDQAHRQMILDTRKDVAKFETALPNLAEFDAFYSVGGERDALDADISLALSGGLLPEVVEFRMADLTNRRFSND